MKKHPGLLAALVARAGADRPRPVLDLLRARLGDDEPDDEAPEPAALPAAVARADTDVAYGAHELQRFDVYHPTRPAAAAPIVVLVHGGGWRRGDKAGRRLLGHKLAHWAGRGCIVVSLNYRLLPEADPLQQAGDVALALTELQRRAAAWGGDASRCVLLGHSAGAHLVALLNADPALAAAQDTKPWRAAVAIDSAALDVETLMTHRHLPLHDQAFGSDPAFWRLASPLQRLQRAPVAPMLLVCAAAREDSCAAAQAFVDRTLAVGGHAELLALALDHFEINAALGSPGAYTEAVDDFLARADVF